MNQAVPPAIDAGDASLFGRVRVLAVLRELVGIATAGGQEEAAALLRDVITRIETGR